MDTDLEKPEGRIPYLERVKLDKEGYAAWRKQQYERHLRRVTKDLKDFYGQD
jgi:hypothetical protein